MTSDKPVSRVDLSGVWKRSLLIDEVGDKDDASEVYWVQFGALCGDIRLHLRQSTLADLAANNGAPFVEAFAGCLIEDGGTFRWEPSLCSFLQDGPPDEGRLSWDGEHLQEDGVHRAYEERWERIEASSTADYALELQHSGTNVRGFVIRVGAFVFYARGPVGRAGDGDRDSEFSLFETGPDGPRLVLSTVDRAAATFPVVEFARAEPQSIHLARWPARADGASQQWRVTNVEHSGTVPAKANGRAPATGPMP